MKKDSGILCQLITRIAFIQSEEWYFQINHRRMKFTHTAAIDYLNIGLILVSLFLAIRLPFELFLFSYAVLGPLHYLTEINWLREKQFFSPGRYDWLWLTLLAFFIFLAFFSTEFFRAGSDNPHPWLAHVPAVRPALAFLEGSGSALVFTALIMSAVFVFTRKSWLRLSLSLAAVVLGLSLRGNLWYGVLFGMFVPTIVHVCLFTGLFMLYGAMKNRSLPGFLSVITLVLAVLVILHLGKGVFLNRQPEEAVVRTYFLSKFQYLNLALFQLLAPAAKVRQYLQENMPWAFMNTVYGWRIQTLIAFAYTYHYLNWFSKTGIIRWHQTARWRLLLAGIIWLASVLLYFYNYHWGLVGLFFLSMLHVFLEFPLNVQSMRGILSGLRIAKAT